MAGLQGRILGVLPTLIGFGVSSSSSYIPGHPTSMCEFGVNTYDI